MNDSERTEYFLRRVQEAGIALVSKADRARLRERHLAPSLEALDLIPESGRLLDIGPGGGFPGIPIAMHRPNLQITLVEANGRKASFLNRVSRETTLNNVSVLNLRVEDLDETHDHRYETVTARAVADLPELVEWTLRLLAPAGRLLLWKSKGWRREGDPADYGVCLLEEKPLSDGSVLLVLSPHI